MMSKGGKKRKYFDGKNESKTKKQKLNTDMGTTLECLNERECLKWILNDKFETINVNEFLRKYLHKKCLLLNRNNKKYYKKYIKFNLNEFYNLIKKNQLKYNEHVMCKLFKNNMEKIHPMCKDRNKIVKLNDMKHIINQGYTIQLHHLQHYSYDIQMILAKLETLFGCEVGSNVYITPYNKQGLSPHWDDVDVYILQLAGMFLYF